MSARLHWPDCWRDPAHHACAAQKVVDAQAEIKMLRERLVTTRALRNHVIDLLGLCEEQALDDGLWFVAEHATEAYLQAALRRLHAAIEGDA